MDYTRRDFLLNEGEPLLLSDSIVGLSARIDAFTAATGIESDGLLISPVCAIPLPLYEADAEDGWLPDQVRPEALWHPLFWLPARLKGRYVIQDPVTGETRDEDDVTWAIRNTLELTASGLYDPVSGTWVDVLSTVGLDIDDEIDLARVTEWLDGSPDEAMDSIDLASAIAIEPTDWALEAALALRADTMRAAAHYVAAELIALAEADHESVPTAASLASSLLPPLLHGVAETPLATEVVRAQAALWTSISQVDPQTVPAHVVMAGLNQVAAECQPSLEALLTDA